MFCEGCELIGVGYDDYQVYLLLSCAPVQGHIAGLVDVSSRPHTYLSIVANRSGDSQRVHNNG